MQTQTTTNLALILRMLISQDIIDIKSRVPHNTKNYQLMHKLPMKDNIIEFAPVLFEEKDNILYVTNDPNDVCLVIFYDHTKDPVTEIKQFFGAL